MFQCQLTPLLLLPLELLEPLDLASVMCTKLDMTSTISNGILIHTRSWQRLFITFFPLASLAENTVSIDVSNMKSLERDFLSTHTPYDYRRSLVIDHLAEISK